MDKQRGNTERGLAFGFNMELTFRINIILSLAHNSQKQWKICVLL